MGSVFGFALTWKAMKAFQVAFNSMKRPLGLIAQPIDPKPHSNFPMGFQISIMIMEC